MALGDLTGQIGSTAAAPAESEVDGLRAKAQPLDQLIKADRYGKAIAAGSLLGLGLRTRQLVHPPQVAADGADAGGGADNFGGQGSFQ